MEHLPRIRYATALWLSQRFTDQTKRNTRKFHRKNSIHVDVQRHFLWNERQRRRMSGTHAKVVSLFARKFGTGQWSFMSPGTEKEVVFFERGQSTRNLGQYCGKDVVGIRRKRMPDFPCYDSIVLRKTQKQRTWKTVDTFWCHSRNN